MSSAFYVVFCFPFFVVSNNIGRAGCKPSRAGLEEKAKGGRRKALVCMYSPRCFIKIDISEQSSLCHLLHDSFQPLRS